MERVKVLEENISTKAYRMIEDEFVNYLYKPIHSLLGINFYIKDVESNNEVNKSLQGTHLEYTYMARKGMYDDEYVDCIRRNKDYRLLRKIIDEGYEFPTFEIVDISKDEWDRMIKENIKKTTH